MEEIRAQAALSVADALVEDVRRQRAYNAEQGPVAVKFPPPVVRAVVLVQAMLRRREFLRSFGGDAEAIAEFAPPDPLLSVALYFCRRMRSVQWIDAESEAMAVAGIVSAKQTGLTLGGVREVIEFYEGVVSDEHMSLMVLREKLDGMIVEVTEALQDRVAVLDTPAEVQAAIDSCRSESQIPPCFESRIFGGPLVRLREVVERAERELRLQLAQCTSVPEYDKVDERLEPMFGAVHTPVRAEIDLARTRRTQFLEMELETRWSRPFAGPLPPHSRAARQYQLELGKDNPKVVDFVAEELRHAASLEATFEVHLSTLQGRMQTLWERRREAKARSMVEEMDAQMSEVSDEIQRAIENAILDIGPQNARVKQRAQELLAADAHAAVFSIQAEQAADELRAELEENDTSPEGADRRRGVASTLLALLDELTPGHPTQAVLRGEFQQELAEAAERADRLSAQDGLLPLPGEDLGSCPATPGGAAHPLEEPLGSKAPPAAAALPPPRPRTAGEPEGEQDPWAAPAGFADLEFLEEPKAVIRKPDGGLPDLSPEAMAAKAAEAAAAPQYSADEKTVAVLHSVQFEGSAPSAPSAVTAHLILTDICMDVVRLHSEAVFSNKFARAISEAAGIARRRIKVTGFDTEPVRVLFSIAEPDPSELVLLSQEVRTDSVDTDGDADAAPGPPSALEVFEAIQRQLGDAGSQLNLGEVGPFIAGAVLEQTGVSGFADGARGPGGRMQTLSLSGAYAAPPLKTRPVGAEGATRGGATSSSSALAGPAERDESPLFAVGSVMSNNTWGASRLVEPAAKTGQKSRVFRTTCPEAEEDSTREVWAQPYRPQPEYSFYERVAQEQARAPVSLPASKRKFTTHASFHITRHPAAGMPSMAGFTSKPAAIAAADSWLDAQAKHEEIGKQLLSQELSKGSSQELPKGGSAVADAIELGELSQHSQNDGEGSVNDVLSKGSRQASTDGVSAPIAMAMEGQAMVGSAAPVGRNESEIKRRQHTSDDEEDSDDSEASPKSASVRQSAPPSAVVQDEPEPEESLDAGADAESQVPSVRREKSSGKLRREKSAGAVGGAEATAPPAQMEVQISCVVANVSYDALKADAGLLGKFEAVMKQALAEECGSGVTPESIRLALSAGSVKVQATILPPSGAEATAIAASLKASDKLCPKIQALVEELLRDAEGLKENADAAISVGSVTEPAVVGAAAAAAEGAPADEGSAAAAADPDAAPASPDGEPEGGRRKKAKKEKKEKGRRPSRTGRVVVEEGGGSRPHSSEGPRQRRPSRDAASAEEGEEGRAGERARRKREKKDREAAGEEEAAADEDAEKRPKDRTRKKRDSDRPPHLVPAQAPEESSQSPAPAADRRSGMGKSLKKKDLKASRSPSERQMRKERSDAGMGAKEPPGATHELDLSTAMGLPAASAFAGMYGGLPGTGLRGLAETNDRLPELVGRPSANNFKSPAYVRKAYRHGTVGVGPPYFLNEPEQEYSPNWTCARLMDAALETEDWRRCYSSIADKIGPVSKLSRLGPDRSIRKVGSVGMGRSVSLPRLKQDGRRTLMQPGEPSSTQEQLSQSMKEKRRQPSAPAPNLAGSQRLPRSRRSDATEASDGGGAPDEAREAAAPRRPQEAWGEPGRGGTAVADSIDALEGEAEAPKPATPKLATQAAPPVVEVAPPPLVEVAPAPLDQAAPPPVERKKKKPKHVPIKVQPQKEEPVSQGEETDSVQADGKAKSKAKAKPKGKAKGKAKTHPPGESASSVPSARGDRKSLKAQQGPLGSKGARSSGASDTEKDAARAGEADAQGKTVDTIAGDHASSESMPVEPSNDPQESTDGDGGRVAVYLCSLLYPSAAARARGRADLMRGAERGTAAPPSAQPAAELTAPALPGGKAAEGPDAAAPCGAEPPVPPAAPAPPEGQLAQALIAAALPRAEPATEPAAPAPAEDKHAEELDVPTPASAEPAPAAVADEATPEAALAALTEEATPADPPAPAADEAKLAEAATPAAEEAMPADTPSAVAEEATPAAAQAAPTEETKPVEAAAPAAEKTEPAEAAASAEEAKPAEAPVAPAEEVKPEAALAATTEAAKPAGAPEQATLATPSEESTPAELPAPAAEEAKPAEIAAPAAEVKLSDAPTAAAETVSKATPAAPTEETKLGEDPVPAAEAKPSEVAKPVEVATPAEETKPTEAALPATHPPADEANPAEPPTAIAEKAQPEAAPAPTTEEANPTEAPAAPTEEAKPEAAPAPTTEEAKPSEAPAAAAEEAKPAEAPAAAAEEAKPAEAAAAAAEEAKPEAAPAPTADEAKPAEAPAAAAEETKLAEAAAPAAEEAKPEAAPAPTTEEAKPAEAPAAAAEEAKPAEAPAAAAEEKPAEAAAPAAEVAKPEAASEPTTVEPTPAEAPAAAAEERKLAEAAAPAAEEAKPEAAPAPTTEEAKPAEAAAAAAEEAKPAEAAAAAAEEARPDAAPEPTAEEARSAEAPAASIEEAKPAEASAPASEGAELEAAPAPTTEEAKPAEAPAAAEEAKPAEAAAPAAAEAKPEAAPAQTTEEAEPAEAPAAAEEAKPAEAAASAAEEAKPEAAPAQTTEEAKPAEAPAAAAEEARPEAPIAGEARPAGSLVSPEPAPQQGSAAPEAEEDVESVASLQSRRHLSAGPASAISMDGSDFGRSIVEYNVVSDMIGDSMASATRGYIQEDDAESVLESRRSSSFTLALHTMLPSTPMMSAPASTLGLEDQSAEKQPPASASERSSAAQPAGAPPPAAAQSSSDAQVPVPAEVPVADDAGKGSADPSAAALQVDVGMRPASEVSSVAGGQPEVASRKSSATQAAGEPPEAASSKSSAALPAARKTSSAVPPLDLQARAGSQRSSAAQGEAPPAGEGLHDEQAEGPVAQPMPMDGQARAASSRSSLAQPQDEGASEAPRGVELLAASVVSAAVLPLDAQAGQHADVDRLSATDASAAEGEKPEVATRGASEVQPAGEQPRPASRGSSGARAAPAAGEGASKAQPTEEEPTAASKTASAVLPLDLSAARGASEGASALAGRPPAPASREAAMMRTLKTNSGATKQEVASFAQSLTSSIFKNTHKSVASRARSTGSSVHGAGARPPRPDAAPSSSSYSPPPVSSRPPSARRRAAAAIEAVPDDHQ